MASSFSEARRAKLADARRSGAIGIKAISFALIGVLNTAVDYSVFLLARAALKKMSAASTILAALNGWCNCDWSEILLLIAANMTSWLVAVTGSYVLNSSITFAAESERKLNWRAYATFVVSGIAGLIANTAALVLATQILLLPVLIAKAIAVLVSFIVNFSLAHLVVFRVRAPYLRCISEKQQNKRKDPFVVPLLHEKYQLDRVL
jgi:putative flippase GtrA